ncbi:accessory gene regulator ArgB-like protein [Dethiobacter alkaliphilus]|uniref:Accessory gene regulator B n=1 Tax=Dethiobacter alkaliphilus AHT 1 TaxID=555088 RepID=C0GEL4_DETAL|nr:accessory gene regulator B family protein [Dethiobacter alkaliphilus]EEG78046.1 Accessory gene regulator B [Dethiobacter alkaliphilus AHT 1]
MKLIELFLIYLSNELNLNESQRDIIRYGVETIASTLQGILAVIITSLLLNLFYEAMVILFVIMIYRKLSGGAHCISSLGCVVVGTTSVIVLAFLSIRIPVSLQYQLLLTLFPPLIALVITYFYAPADVPEKPINNQRQRTALRTLSIICLCIWTATVALAKLPVWIIYAGSLGILWQAFLLTPAGFSFIKKINPIFSR